jgi:hypothetical protein
MGKNEIHGIFNDEELTLDACKAFRDKGIRVKDVFSPFPIHGIDPVIGVPRTRLHVGGFLYGLMGLALAWTMFYFTMVLDWPMNIGGKPSFTFFENLPAWIPVSFEMTVWCSGHGMILSYLIVNKLYPGKKAWNPDPRTTDDKFLVQIDIDANHGHTVDEVTSILKDNGAEEVSGTASA